MLTKKEEDFVRALIKRNIPLNGRRVILAGDAIDPQDYVTKKQVDGVIDQVEEISQDLQGQIADSVTNITNITNIVAAGGPGYWTILTIFDEVNGDIVYDSLGDVISMFVPE